MKGLKHFLNQPSLKFYEELVKSKALRAELHGKEASFFIDRDVKLSAEADLILQLTRGDTYRITNLFCVGKMIEDGVKVFRPTVEQCLALSNIEVRVDFTEYTQPFETMVVEFPRDYMIYESKSFEGDTRMMSPDFQIMYWNGKVLCTCITASDAKGEFHGITTCLADGIIEDHLYIATRNGMHPTEAVLDREKEVIKIFDRISFNSMLLMMEYGCKRKGYDNESFAKRLLKKPKYGNNAEQLRRIPEIYETDKEIELFNYETISNAGDSHTGRVQGPHIRRGHWHTFLTGPGRTEKVRKLVKAVKVNWHLMADKKPPMTIYKTGGT